MQSAVKYFGDYMETKKFNGFDNKGCLPFGIYVMALEEFEEIFVNSPRREEIMHHYRKHLQEIQNSPHYLNHWINGSFVTLKENPMDIDTLTEFDGVTVDKSNELEKIDAMIQNAYSKSNKRCHSLAVYKYPESYSEEYEKYLEIKNRTLILFAIHKETRKPKGFIKLEK